MSGEIGIQSLEDMLRDTFEHERESLLLPPGIASSVFGALDGNLYRETRSSRIFKPAHVGALVALVIGILGATAAVVLLAGDSDSEKIVVEPGLVDEPGPVLPQVADEPQIKDYGEYRQVGAHTVERAPAALEAAIGILPYRVDLPTYLPQGLRLSHLGAQVTTGDPPVGNMSLAYTLPANGTRQLSLQISWVDHGRDAGESAPEFDLPGNFEDILPTPIPGNTFSAGGYEWRTSLIERSRGDTWEAVTMREDGVQLFVSLRVAGGLDRDETLAELQKVVESMRPAQAE